MPIGKNAIKRVENNGYSKVASAAPDMENSTVITKLSEEVMEKMVKPVEEKTKAKAEKKTPAKKVEKKEPAKKTPAKKACAKNTCKNGFERVSVGSDMPYYLL